MFLPRRSLSCYCAFLGIMTVKALSTWSETAIKAARELTIVQKEKLLAEEGVFRKRLVTITAERLETTTSTNTESDSNVVTKIIHFQRHGQGYHNLLGDMLREAGMKLDHSSRDPSVNPWIRPEIRDSPLTESGIQQCIARRPQAALLSPQAVIVSPLLRAIQTAKLSFADHGHVPWVAHEGCREDLGVLQCNRRRPLSTIKADYPDLDTSHMMDEEDLMWDPDNIESAAAKSDRVYDFLVDFISKRPEAELAVVGHSAWLFHMCNAVVDCGDDDELASWFLTSEIRSMRVSFTTQE